MSFVWLGWIAAIIPDAYFSRPTWSPPTSPAGRLGSDASLLVVDSRDEMANVFLSYAREDSARAAIIAKALSRRWTVWWDRTIPPGKTFDDVIEEALDRAACVVVLWSRTSVLSHWVRSEAAEGARRGISCRRFSNREDPLEFRRVQAANLAAWNGDSGDPEFEQFIRSISTLIEPTTDGPPIASPRIAEPIFDTFESTPEAGRHRNSGSPHSAAHMRSLASRPSPSWRQSGAALPGGRRPGRQQLPGDGNARRSRPHQAAAIERAARRGPIPVSTCHRSLAGEWMPRGRNSNASG